jgi:hypothetical protein
MLPILPHPPLQATELVAGLRRRGFAISAKGDGVLVSPASKLTDADRQAIRASKAELLAALAAEASAETPPGQATVVRHRPTYLPCSCPSGVCWPCCNRPCEVCGAPTGSAFIRRCGRCGELPDAA